MTLFPNGFSIGARGDAQRRRHRIQMTRDGRQGLLRTIGELIGYADRFRDVCAGGAIPVPRGVYIPDEIDRAILDEFRN